MNIYLKSKETGRQLTVNGNPTPTFSSKEEAEAYAASNRLPSGVADIADMDAEKADWSQKASEFSQQAQIDQARNKHYLMPNTAEAGVRGENPLQKLGAAAFDAASMPLRASYAGYNQINQHFNPLVANEQPSVARDMAIDPNSDGMFKLVTDPANYIVPGAEQALGGLIRAKAPAALLSNLGKIPSVIKGALTGAGGAGLQSLGSDALNQTGTGQSHEYISDATNPWGLGFGGVLGGTGELLGQTMANRAQRAVVAGVKPSISAQENAANPVTPEDLQGLLSKKPLSVNGVNLGGGPGRIGALNNLAQGEPALNIDLMKGAHDYGDVAQNVQDETEYLNKLRAGLLARSKGKYMLENDPALHTGRDKEYPNPDMFDVMGDEILDRVKNKKMFASDATQALDYLASRKKDFNNTVNNVVPDYAEQGLGTHMDYSTVPPKEVAGANPDGFVGVTMPELAGLQSEVGRQAKFSKSQGNESLDDIKQNVDRALYGKLHDIISNHSFVANDISPEMGKAIDEAGGVSKLSRENLEKLKDEMQKSSLNEWKIRQVFPMVQQELADRIPMVQALSRAGLRDVNRTPQMHLIPDMSLTAPFKAFAGGQMSPDALSTMYHTGREIAPTTGLASKAVINWLSQLANQQ